jgi:energy-coupling factor transport system ATP-binding protein
MVPELRLTRASVTPEMNAGIVLNNVTFAYQPTIPVVHDVSLTIKPGEFVGIVGPNGSGKTTLAKLFNGNLQPTSGIVLVDGLSTKESQNQLAIKRLVTSIHADPENQLITPTVFNEITFALQAMQIDSNEVYRRGEEALDEFRLRQHRNIHPFYLSVGEQFRVLIAAAVVRQPHYIILDEVQSMLDSYTRNKLLQMLLDLRFRRGLSVVLLTHRLDDLLNADRTIVIQNGQIQADSTAASIFAQAMTRKDWNIETPLIYQIYSLVHSERQEAFRELRRLISGVIPDNDF